MMKRDDELIDDELIEDGDGVGAHRLWKRRVLTGLGALALIGAGLVGGLILGERRAATSGVVAKGAPASPSVEGHAAGSQPATPDTPAVARPDPPAGGTTDEAVEVALTPDAVARAGIRIAAVKSGAMTGAVTVPATVTSNAYRDTKVNALVGGIVRQVSAELGSPARRGQPLAVIFSSELADAQTKYLSTRATLRADHQKRERTRKLAELGAASQQELEEVTAVHDSHETELAAARQRLLLLGLSPDDVAKLEHASQVVSEVIVPSPADGVVITRAVNPGQVVGAGQELFVVTDLSTVWVIADLYEKDFSLVRVGGDARITVPTAPGAPLRGRVAYIDPRVDPATRTAKLRVEVANPNLGLRLGMFVTVALEAGSGQRAVVVPRAAVQAVGERMVVYVALEEGEGRFVERAVKLGSATGDLVQVLEGLRPGEKVVSEGSFFLRAEAARSRPGS